MSRPPSDRDAIRLALDEVRRFARARRRLSMGLSVNQTVGVVDLPASCPDRVEASEGEGMGGDHSSRDSAKEDNT